MTQPTTQPMTDDDRATVRECTQKFWNAPHIVVRGKLYYPHEAEGFIFRHQGEIVGLITFMQLEDEILMLTQNSLQRGAGIGASLVLRMIEEARRREVRRLWLTTTNDNLRSLGFYQRMGFRLVCIYRDAVTEARRTVKPEIPENGEDGLPINDEIELELILEPRV